MTELLPGLYSVSVPEEATNIEDTKADGIMWKMPDGSYDSFYFENDDIQEYQIIGTVTADTIDFDCEPYCEKVNNEPIIEAGVMSCVRYKNHLTQEQLWNAFNNPDSSFRSLLTSKGQHFVNPYGEKEPEESGLNVTGLNNSLLFKWQQAEQNLVKKLVIIKKVK